MYNYNIQLDRKTYKFRVRKQLSWINAQNCFPKGIVEK